MIIESIASNRIADFGGWTDTWFSRTGHILNFAVDLYARVTVVTKEQAGVTIHVQDYGDVLEIPSIEGAGYDDKHALLIAALKVMNIKQGLYVFISADVPPGCGTGSSAAVSVALIKALSVLNGEYLVAHEIARFAHRLETEELRIESGIQDQLAAAYGGVSFIEMYEYPNAYVSPVDVSEETRMTLENRWILVYEGRRHLSGDVHKKVIQGLKDEGSASHRALSTLKETALAAKHALLKGDIIELGKIMDLNNAAQKALHPEITTANFEKIEAIARRVGIVGAMINGAGGGGSIVLIAEAGKKTEIERALAKEGFRTLPCRMSFQPARAWVGG
jgi:D-glycero-alpha-D-manno-heptose-7-phosphate kinase